MVNQKIYCGYKNVPRGKVRGTREQCRKIGQIRYYGIEKEIHEIEKIIKEPGMPITQLENQIIQLENKIFGTPKEYIQMIPLANIPTSAREQINYLVFKYNYEQDYKENLTFDSWFIIGSFGYKQQKYWGDMDIRENVIFCCDKNGAIEAFISTLKKIVGKYSTGDRNVGWFKEFKCGVDERYSFTNPQDAFYYMTLNGVTKKQFLIKLNELKNNNAIEMSDYNEIIKVLSQEKSKDYIENKCDEEKILSILRKYYVVRWTVDEIFMEYKILHGGYRFNLRDALSQHQSTNLECVAVIDGTLLDVSNFFTLGYIPNPEYAGLDKLPPYGKPRSELTNKAIVINFNQSRFNNFIFHTINNLREAANELLFSCYSQDSFKAIKRIWSMCRTVLLYSQDKKFIKQCEHILIKLIPFYSSDVSNLNSVKNGIKIISEMIKGDVPNFPTDLCIKQIDNMKFRLGKITILDNEIIVNEFNPILDKMLHELENDYLDDAADTGSFFASKCAKIINEKAYDYLKFVGLLPLPKILESTGFISI